MTRTMVADDDGQERATDDAWAAYAHAHAAQVRRAVVAMRRALRFGGRGRA